MYINVEVFRKLGLGEVIIKNSVLSSLIVSLLPIIQDRISDTSICICICICKSTLQDPKLEYAGVDQTKSFKMENICQKTS